MGDGYLCLVLHAHLPFVRHPEHDEFLEEDWLFEAIGETYLPLLELCRRLIDDGIGARFTLSITPTLAAMLEDRLLQDRYIRHVERLCELAEEEVRRTRWTPELQTLALRYRKIFKESRRLYVDVYRRDLLGGFRSLQEAGLLELITSGATHGFLPLMLGRRNLWRAQVLTAAAEHRRHFGRSPPGIWLPECGFQPGVDEILGEAGIRYFFSDSHGILRAHPRPRYGVHSPVLTPGGVAAFGRDPEASRQVWCSWLGYPGDFAYREFYRDIGWDLDYEYIQPFLHPDGNRTSLGIKYYRTTGPTDQKEPYDFEQARARAVIHARHFLDSRRKQAAELKLVLGRNPVIVAPYDAELFGHWWYEGPHWLESLLRMVADDDAIEAVSPSDYLRRIPTQQVGMPSASSWGLRGYAEHWLDASNDWIYPHLHMAGDRMIELANRFRTQWSREGKADLREASDPDGRECDLMIRALRQAGRELLLAQSSDWAFILKAGTMSGYAERRSREHLGNFHRLYNLILAGRIEKAWLTELESRHSIFPELDPGVFADPD